MERILLLIIFVIALAQGVSSQEVSKSHFGIMADASLTLQRPENSDFIDASSAFSGRLSFMTYTDLHERWQLCSGVGMNFMRIDQVDYSPVFPADSSMFMVDLKHSYVEQDISIIALSVHTNIRYRIAGEQNKFFIAGGGEVRYRLADSEDAILYESETLSYEIDSNPFNMLTKSNVLLSVSFGYEFAGWGDTKLYVEAVYKHGITNLFNATVQPQPENNSKLSEVGVCFGITL